MALTSSCIHCWTPVSIKKIRDDPWAEWQTYNHTEFMKTWDKGYNFEEKKFKARMQAIKLKYPDKSSRLLPLCCENKLKPLTSLPFQSAKPVPMQPPFGCPSALSASVRLSLAFLTCGCDSEEISGARSGDAQCLCALGGGTAAGGRGDREPPSRRPFLHCCRLSSVSIPQKICRTEDPSFPSSLWRSSVCVGSKGSEGKRTDWHPPPPPRWMWTHKRLTWRR